MNKKVSVIVPVYNAEQYLDECMESLVHQTLEETEIIAVDDASTDSSQSILRRYQREYPQKVKILLQEKNSRQGAARNRGLKAASGKYVCFVDSDDALENHALLLLYEKGETENCDIVFCDYAIFGASIERQYGQHVYSPYLGNMTMEKRKALLTTSVVPWAKLIRRSLIVENKIQFPEQCSYEDQATTYLFYLYANRTARVAAPLYQYRISEHSTTTQMDAKRHFDHMDMALLLVERVKKRGFAENYQAELEFFLFEQMYILGIRNCIKQFSVLPEEYILALYKNFIKHCPNYKENLYYRNYASERDKKILEMHQQSQSRMLQEICTTDFRGFCPNYMMSIRNNKERVNQLFSYIQKNGFQTALWGAGKYAIQLIECMEEMGYEFDYIIDRNPERKGKTYGKYNISYFDVLPQVSLILIPYTEWSYSIKNELKAMRIAMNTLDLEVFIKHDLKIGLEEYMERTNL